jgi:dTDP-4-dehydrorhamnose reductase
MRVLVTGAAGQVGRALLQGAPDHATCVGLSHADLDIGDEGAVRSCVSHHHPDVIVNAAAYTAVDKAQSEPDPAARINIGGPRHLASCAGELGARLVHISTDFVFDGLASSPYRPEASTNPLNVYGRTKRAGEEAVLGILPERSVVLRTAWVYAAEGRNFVRTMLRLMAANGSVRVVSDQIGTPTSAHSVAGAIWRILDHPDLTGIHHWTDAGVASWYDFAVAIAEEAASLELLPSGVAVLPIATEDYPTPARRPPYSVLNRASLAVLRIAPVHWREALRVVLREIRNG